MTPVERKKRVEEIRESLGWIAEDTPEYVAPTEFQIKFLLSELDRLDEALKDIGAGSCEYYLERGKDCYETWKEANCARCKAKEALGEE